MIIIHSIVHHRVWYITFPMVLAHYWDDPVFQRSTIPKFRVRDRVRVSRVSGPSE